MYEMIDLVACSVAFLDEVENNENVCKQDVIDSMRKRLCIITGKIVSYPIITNFSLPCVTQELTMENNPELMSFFANE